VVQVGTASLTRMVGMTIITVWFIRSKYLEQRYWTFWTSHLLKLCPISNSTHGMTFFHCTLVLSEQCLMIDLMTQVVLY